MNCQDAAEFVSALLDGERIPQEAARHIGGCEVCGTRMRKYAVMGAELRRSACATQIDATVVPGWSKPHRFFLKFWQKGAMAMRIPRFAFVSMLILIVSLATGIVIARANISEQWFQFQVKTRDGGTAEVGIMKADPKGEIPDPGPNISVVSPDGVLTVIVRVLDAKGGMEKLGIRALWLPPSVTQSDASAQVKGSSESEVWMVPGQELLFPVSGYGNLSIVGRLLDKLPDDNDPREQKLYPKQGEFRLLSPQTLLRDGRVISTGGGDGLNLSIENYFAYFAPHDGWYVIAFRNFPGAREGVLRGNRVQFHLDGKSYELIAAAPIVEGAETKIWARYIPGNRLTDDAPPNWANDNSSSMMSFGEIGSLSKRLQNK